MKKIFLIMLLVGGVAYADLKEPQKFKVVYRVTYNAQTLARAVETEKRIKKENGDACKIEVDVSSPGTSGTLKFVTPSQSCAEL